MEYQEKKSGSVAWYMLGGLAIGTVLGVLFAPKRGDETRRDLAELGRRGKEKGRQALNRIGETFPGIKNKVAAGFPEEEDEGRNGAHDNKKVGEPFIS